MRFFGRLKMFSSLVWFYGIKTPAGHTMPKSMQGFRAILNSYIEICISMNVMNAIES